MKVDLMRKIDFFAGMPLTFLLDIFFFFFKRRNSAPRNNNVLLIELSEMGSAILADPMMKHLKSKDKNLFFVIFKKNVPSLNLLKTVDEKNIFTIDESSFTSLAHDVLELLFWCRNKRIDTVIDLELFSRFTSIITALCGARKRVGFYNFTNEGCYRGRYILNHKISYNPHLHIAKNFMAISKSLEESKTPNFKGFIADNEIVLTKATIEPQVREKMQKVLQENDVNLNHRLVIINANASDLLPHRRWENQNYCSVISKILQDYDDITVILTGAPSEREKLQSQIKSHFVKQNRVVNFAGQTTFEELSALYSLCEVMITNDSGPAHFASTTNIKVIVLFGPETPRLYGPLGNGEAISANLACSPCVSAYNHRNTPCHEPVCMRAIGWEKVYETLCCHLEVTKSDQ